MFTIELVVNASERRRSPRSPVDMPGRISSANSWRSVCRVEDLSCHGVRLSTFSALTRGLLVWLHLPDVAARQGEVVWADDFRAACKFRVPLDQKMVAGLVERFGHDVKADRPVEMLISV